MNRHQRRALAKINGKTSSLGHATGQLQEAVTALQAVQGLETLPSQLKEAHQLMVEAHATVSALVEDYQGMADEIEALKAVVFQSSPDTREMFQKQLLRIRAERAAETATPGQT